MSKDKTYEDAFIKLARAVEEDKQAYWRLFVSWASALKAATKAIRQWLDKQVI